MLRAVTSIAGAASGLDGMQGAANGVAVIAGSSQRRSWNCREHPTAWLELQGAANGVTGIAGSSQRRGWNYYNVFLLNIREQ